MTYHLYKKPLQLQKQLVLEYAKRTQLTLGYIFRIGVPGTYFNCNNNTQIYTGLIPPVLHITITLVCLRSPCIGRWIIGIVSRK